MKTLTNIYYIPCKIGDTVWAIRNYKGSKLIQQGIVSEIFFVGDMQLCIVVKNCIRGTWGITVFPSYEEAHQYLLNQTSKGDFENEQKT